MRSLALVLALSGCSVALQSKPGAKSGCHTSHAYWIADAVVAAAGTAALAYAIATPGEDVIAAPGALVGVLFLASAHNGYKWRRECVRGESAH